DRLRRRRQRACPRRLYALLVSVVLGPDEVAANAATLRDMNTHEQAQIPMDQLVKRVRERL
ncbi:MAG: His/Gly/Thr/Pro-type tRNA ligase C-terminal domain-containing protein, partial [Atopobiaceae bacterium]